MPHIIVEYTEHLSEDIPKLLTELHSSLAGQPTVDIHAVKTRAVPVQYVVVGDGNEPDKLIHITVKLLPGRDDALKKTIGQALHDTARAQTKDDRITITVEVMDLHAESYIK